MTARVESAVLGVLLPGPRSWRDLELALPTVFRDRLGAVVWAMLGDGRIRVAGCGHAAHEHHRGCVLALAT